MSLKNKLKLARIESNDLTQQDLARLVGCSRQTIISIESTRFLPSVELAMKLACVLNKKVEELFYFDDAEV